MALKRSISHHRMENWNSRVITFWTIAIVAFLSACTLGDPEPTDQSPALSLHFEQNLSLTKLSWEHVKVTGFKEYILLQSALDIPDSPTPVVNQNVTVVTRIKDVDMTSFLASPVLFTPTVYYKLYCAVDDRFLYSPTIPVLQNIDAVNGFYDSGCHMPGNDEMVMFDRTTDHLSTVNYKTVAITSTAIDLNFSFPSLEMSQWNDVTNVLGFDQSPATLRKFNYPSLLNTGNVIFNQVLWAARSYHQFVFVATEEFGKGFQVLNKNNFSVIASAVGLSNNQNIAVFPGDTITVITFGVNGSKKYGIDAMGKIVSQQDLSVSLLQANLQSTCAQGSELFIADATGSIFNHAGERMGSLSFSVNSFIQIIRLSPDEKKAIFIVNENGIQRLQIADLSNLPAVTLLKSYDLPALNYADIIPEEDIIYVAGALFNSNQNQTFILKFPM